jgi:hypothetical protein
MRYVRNERIRYEVRRTISVISVHQSGEPTGLVGLERCTELATVYRYTGDTESSTILSDLTDKSLRGPNGL